jgi:diguanylate cyclase (GGDEF)-like protein
MTQMQAEQSKGEILIVDDTLENLNILSQILSDKGYKVQHARNGELALKLAGTSPPDLILLDILLPDMDGYTVCEALKNKESICDIPVIFVSALSGALDKTRAFAVGGADYVTGPFQPEEVLARVQTHLRLSRQQRYIQEQDAFLEAKHHELAEVTTKLEIELAERVRADKELARVNQELQQLASLDGLTQIPNRRRFDEVLAQEWKRQARTQDPLSLILCDVDYFTRYNDMYGHQTGDECLQKIARAVANTARRPGDLSARYSGEEFAVILPDTDADGAMHVARLIQNEVRALKIVHEGSEVSRYVTLSIGVFCVIPKLGTSPDFLIRSAELARYQVKEQGRNAVIFANITVPSSAN